MHSSTRAIAEQEVAYTATHYDDTRSPHPYFTRDGDLWWLLAGDDPAREQRERSSQHRRDRRQQRHHQAIDRVHRGAGASAAGRRAIARADDGGGGTRADAERRGGSARADGPRGQSRSPDARAGRAADADVAPGGDPSRTRSDRGAGTVDGSAGPHAAEPRSRVRVATLARSRVGPAAAVGGGREPVGQYGSARAAARTDGTTGGARGADVAAGRVDVAARFSRAFNSVQLACTAGLGHRDVPRGAPRDRQRGAPPG